MSVSEIQLYVTFTLSFTSNYSKLFIPQFQVALIPDILISGFSILFLSNIPTC